MKVRKSYSLEYKEKVVKLKDVYGLKNISLKLGISKHNIMRWERQQPRIRACNEKRQRRRLTPTISRAKHHQEEILLDKWIKSKREKSFVINTKAILSKMLKLIPQRAQKSYASNFSWIGNFKKRFKIVRRRITTFTNKKSLDEMKNEKERFIERVKTVIRDHNIKKENFLNLDETRLMVNCPGKYTLDYKGAKDIVIKTVGNRKAAITVILSTTANGQILKSFLIFRGKKFD